MKSNKDRPVQKKSTQKKKRNIGLPPGSARYTGADTEHKVIVNYVEYDLGQIKAELDRTGTEIILHPFDENKIQWYDVRGLHDENLIKLISTKFEMHPLAIEDAVDIYQRPNYSEYENGHFISLKQLTYDQEAMEVKKQAVSIYFGKAFVLTFQQDNDDVFKTVRHRLEAGKGRIRGGKSDYLAYALVDYIVDSYYSVMDTIEEEIEELEEFVSKNADQMDKSKIYTLKKQMLKIRRSIAPLREAINLFSRSDSELIDQGTITYIRDVYDHTIQIIDGVDAQRDVLSGLQDLYISEISLKMNRIMQFLTIITAVFVPLSFLTGLYGMNFDYIPELKYRNGYFVLWGGMIVLVVGMLFYFKRKRWL